MCDLWLCLQMRVSKEVQALRDYEQALLKGYQAYLKTLLAAATATPTATSATAAAGHSGSSMLATKRVAVRCMGQLLVARPGFNYCSDLLQALVPMMLGPDAQVQGAACDAIRQLLQGDVQVGGAVDIDSVAGGAWLLYTVKCADQACTCRR
jgi:nucleolar complex protein 3